MGYGALVVFNVAVYCALGMGSIPGQCLNAQPLHIPGLGTKWVVAQGGCLVQNYQTNNVSNSLCQCHIYYGNCFSLNGKKTQIK